jgi:ABC-type multidrug transport system fused ATPase/permease subunit
MNWLLQLRPLAQMSDQLDEFQRARAGVVRLQQLMRYDSSVKAPRTAGAEDGGARGLAAGRDRAVGRQRRAGVSFERMTEVLGGAPAGRLVQHCPIRGPVVEHPSPGLRSTAALQTLHVEDLTYLYPASRRGIERVSFSISRGECVIVMGPVAAGNTTLLRVLLGLLPRDFGRIM